MSEYITQGTKLPNYYRFPEYLLRLPVSQTAKLVYMLLYDRAVLSMKNGWVRGGKVFTLYPIAELAEDLGRSRTVIKNAMEELTEKGLLEREKTGFARPNTLYVLLPASGRNSDPMGKPADGRTENRPHEGRKTVPVRGGKPSPKQSTDTDLQNHGTGESTRAGYGRYRNVLLTKDEYHQLRQDYPRVIDRMIDEMSAYCMAQGKTYRNYEAALRSWADRESGGRKKTPSAAPDYSFGEGESF